jgi:hypothetical protein
MKHHTKKFLVKQKTEAQVAHEQEAICPQCKGKKARSARLCQSCHNWNGKMKRAKEKQAYLKAHPEVVKRAKVEAELKRFERKQTYLEIRREVLTYYGNGVTACAECGYDTFESLDIDHIDGVKNYKGTARSHGKQLIFWLYKNNYPKGFQTLCRNCNWEKRFAPKHDSSMFNLQRDLPDEYYRKDGSLRVPASPYPAPDEYLPKRHVATPLSMEE